MTVEKDVGATHSFLFLFSLFFFDIWCDKNNSSATGRENLISQHQCGNSISDFYSHWHENRKTRKRRKTTKIPGSFVFNIAVLQLKIYIELTKNKGGRVLQDELSEWLELCVIIGFSSRTAYVNPTWTSLLRAHAVYLYTGMLKIGKKHMSAHVLFTLVSHLRDGPARLHTQTVPLYSQTEARSWTGAIPSANEVNQHKRGGGDCNYLSVFPQKTVFCFKDTRHAPDSFRPQNHFHPVTLSVWLDSPVDLCRLLH